jgi:hypothetical protein
MDFEKGAGHVTIDSDDDIVVVNRKQRRAARSLSGMHALVVELASRTGPITRAHLIRLADELLAHYGDADSALDALRNGSVKPEKLC